MNQRQIDMIAGSGMGNVTTTLEGPVRAALIEAAQDMGISLSTYVAVLIMRELPHGEAMWNEIRKVRSEHDSVHVTLPPAVVEHVGTSVGRYLRFSPVTRGTRGTVLITALD